MSYLPVRSDFVVVGESINDGRWGPYHSNAYDYWNTASHYQGQLAERDDYRNLSIVVRVWVDIPATEWREDEPLSYLEGIEVCCHHVDPDWIDSDVGQHMTYEARPDSIPAEVAATVIKELRSDVTRLNAEAMKCRALVKDAVELLGGGS